VTLLCREMETNRSGYYKWRFRVKYPTVRAISRMANIKLLREIHGKHPSHGYRWLAAKLREKTGEKLSDLYVHRCCKFAGIIADSRHYHYKKPGNEKIVFPNIIKRNWDVGKPSEVIVSDMTSFYHKGKYYELTLYMDVFNNEIISHVLSSKRGDPRTYYEGLKIAAERMKKEQTGQVIVLHTDQGAVYSSERYNSLLNDFSITHSMSRAGTPTDNPVMESINGWIKEEMITDFKMKKCDDIFKFIDDYVKYYNNERQAYSLKYKNPVQFRLERGFK
jgi:putative transposase